MYRILIVDNESIIVDGLYHLFLGVDHHELDIYKAYSSSEALQQMAKNKIDIALLDIQMPGMNGLELQQKIMHQWPWCKVIFLTGFTDFAYMQSAIRSGVADYVLKTEGDNKILETLDKVIDQIRKESLNERFLIQAKQELDLARPMLQKEFIGELLGGERGFQDAMEQKLRALHIPLTTADPVYMVLGRVDQWPETIDSSDKPLMVFAILNIIQEYLNTLNIFSMACDKTYFLCMLQPKGIDEESALGRTEKWASKISFVNGMLDSIQNTCRQLLKLPISLVTSGTLTDWKDVSRDFDLLRQEMSKGLGRGHEVILTSRAKHPVAGRSENLYRGNAYNFKLLESYMDSGHEEGFSELCASMLENAFGPVEQYSKYMEVYFGIAMLLLTALNRRELSKAMYENRELDKLMNIDAHITWKAAAEYLNMLAKQMFHSAREDQQGKSNAIAERLNAYIEEHLHEDLSLNRLSEVVYLNPAYVSRLYKQTMGVGLAEIISQKRMHRALDLLVNTPMKIQNVAGEVGLETGYFIKLFKKNMKLTPQEYRESLGNREL